MNWWGNMDLTVWCGDRPVDVTDFEFALAIAAERAGRRGVRQRVAFDVGLAGWVVEDVVGPRPVAVAS